MVSEKIKKRKKIILKIIDELIKKGKIKSYNKFRAARILDKQLLEKFNKVFVNLS